MDDRVVVGYDTSPESADAVRWAATQAQARGWALDVVHVWGFAGQEGGGAGDSWLGREVRKQVHEVAEEGVAIAREAAPGVVATPVVAHGSPVTALVDRAADARLVVVGRHGAGGALSSLTGSVTTGVLHRAASAVVVVPRGSWPAARSGDAVVVGFDGSPGAFGALEAAADHVDQAGTDRLPLVVVAAWSAVGAAGRGAPDSPEAGDRLLDRVRNWAATRDDVAVTCDVHEGRPVQVLERLSRQAALVVVGTRGRSGFAGLVLGSTSRAVVQRAHCPVLVVRRAVGAAGAAPALGASGGEAGAAADPA